MINLVYGYLRIVEVFELSWIALVSERFEKRHLLTYR